MSSSEELRGTAALVTGASSGIGEATVRRLAAAGAAVALVARRGERLQRLATGLEDGGCRAITIEADLTEPGEAERAVASAAADLGRIDALVNNAGVMLLGPIAEAPVEEWRQMVELNLLALMHCARAALPHLRAAAEGPRGVTDLVNISSVAGRVARPGSGVYSATKHGVGAFSESLRQELAQAHVRVSLVEPGVVDTELPTHNRPEVRAQMAERFAGVTRMQAGDIADIVHFVVTRPRGVAINELLVRPTDQVL